MQVALDILKLIFFPGLLFVVACGYIVLYFEAGVRSAFYGGSRLKARNLAWTQAELGTASTGELAAAALSLAAMGVAGVMLVETRGDLFLLALLLSAAEVLPLFLVNGMGGYESLRVPLLFRTAFYRTTSIALVVLSLSLRFPATFSPRLEDFRGEGAFGAVRLWSGADLVLVLASLSGCAVAFLVVLLGRPALPARRTAGGEEEERGITSLTAEASQRAVSLLLAVVVFLGYPWEGGMGRVLWSAAVLGTAAALSALRAWVEGHDRVFRRRLQAAAPLLGLLSLALAFAAAA